MRGPTPRPWAVIRDDGHGAWIAGPDGEDAPLVAHDAEGLSDPMSSADARLTVEAVNAYDRLRELLIREHRAVVSEWSDNFGGHVAIREGWAEYDAETPIEDCDVCTALVRGTPVPEEATLPSGDARVAAL